MSGGGGEGDKSRTLRSDSVERVALVLDGNRSPDDVDPHPIAAIQEGAIAEGEVTFDLLHLHSIPAINGQVFLSPRFALCGRTWVLRFFMNGNVPENDGWVCAFLHPDPLNKVAFAMTIYGKLFLPDGRTIKELGMDDPVCILPVDSGRGFGQFIKRPELFVAVGAEDRVLLKLVVRFQGALPITKPLPQSSLGRDLSAAWHSGIGSDLTLVAQGRLFHVHKFVLSARSSVLKSMLENDRFAEGVAAAQAKPIELKEIEPDVLENVLEYVYSGNVVNKKPTVEWWITLLAAADWFAMHDLLELCQAQIAALLTPANVVQCLNTAIKFADAESLRAAAIEFFKTHDVPEEEVQKLEPQTMMEIIMRHAILRVTVKQS